MSKANYFLYKYYLIAVWLKNEKKKHLDQAEFKYLTKFKATVVLEGGFFFK